jgi:uncharacterized membrane protein HdeD (DUF308 family)
MPTEHHNELVVSTNKRFSKGWFISIGILSIILGTVAILFPLWATLSLELFIGVLLLIVGVLELFRIFFDGSTGNMVKGIYGVMAIIAGLLLLLYPLEGMFTLTSVLAFFFLVGGIFKASAALTIRPGYGWGWMLTSGIISVLLGIVVLAALPASALWVLGILFGIDLLFLGAAQLSFATVTR